MPWIVDIAEAQPADPLEHETVVLIVAPGQDRLWRLELHILHNPGGR